MVKFILILIAYILGAIPFSVILGKKFKGIDVRTVGSKNPGGTNSLRFLGKTVGFIIIFLDIIKGGLIVFLVHQGVFDQYGELFHPLVYGLASGIGHVFSVFIKFRGGKMVATSVGMVLAYNPLVAGVMLIVFLTTLKLGKYVSMASTVTALSLPIIGLIISDYQMALYGAIGALLVVYRHQENYRKIRNGTETKISWM